MMEIWKPVVRFPHYMVSDQGRVYSHLSQKYLRPGIASHGYPTVALGRGNSRTLHSLVAEAFIGPPPENMEVRHKDGNRQNPKLSNLEYGTRRDNIMDAYFHGTRTKDKDRLKGLKTHATRMRNGGYKKDTAKAVATKDEKYPGWRQRVFQQGGFSQ